MGLGRTPSSLASGRQTIARLRNEAVAIVGEALAAFDRALEGRE